MNYCQEEDLHLVKVFQAGISPPQSKCVLRREDGWVAEERRHVRTLGKNVSAFLLLISAVTCRPLGGL